MTVSNSELLAERLLDPNVYPHPCSRVTLVETHISWVFLTGLRAYKIKKPVDLGFVDFTSLERRRRFCEEELRLNRRLAPDLYLDVVRITGTVDRPRIDGDGPVLDYAVCMRQFDQSQLMNRLMEHGQVTRTQIDNLAETVAKFHSRLAVADNVTEFGLPESVDAPVAQNFQQLLPAMNSPLKEIAEELQEWSEFQFKRLREQFEQRKRSGMIRECHGDMHLGNMFLDATTGAVTIFDGIEFNDALRWIDVISEIAFVVMDLEDRGRPDLARRFLNQWLEHTGDYSGLRVLPFYLAYRAVVRAKVDAIRMDQSHVDRVERQHLNDDCAGYLHLAQKYTRATRPVLTITNGLSGSGKTTGTQGIIERLGAIRVRSDIERKRLHGLKPLQHSTGNIYSNEATARTYDRLADLATEVIDAGFPVVVDATFLKRAVRERFRRLADHLDVPFFILTFSAEADVLRERIRARAERARDPSEADEKVLDTQLHCAEEIQADEQEHAIDAQDELERWTRSQRSRE